MEHTGRFTIRLNMTTQIHKEGMEHKPKKIKLFGNVTQKTKQFDDTKN